MIPASFVSYTLTQPVAKIVLDSLNGIAWVDDSKVSILTVRKQYSDAYEGIRVWVEAEPTDRRDT